TLARLNAFTGRNNRQEVHEMMPIGPLMIEHRLIERMIEVMKRHHQRWEKEGAADPSFTETAVDFIRTYADRCHHGKEEGILFRDLHKKPISEDHNRIMRELVEEHEWARKTTRRLIEANEAYLKGDSGAASAILDCVKSLVEFYPRHIEKEDRHFFLPIMEYFSKEEKDAMLKEEYEFDRILIHDLYRDYVTKEEQRL
ncbi:MAG: hemerythrin domain-containing protein, partial [Thermodesulfobacteriota bacterium]